MRLPVRPPVPPMLAKVARALPEGDLLYEPKWDGFRCLAFREGEAVELQSRHGRPLGRYFPEIVEALARLDDDAFAVDGEIVVAGAGGLDFAALLARVHPAASRVALLRARTPASYVVFDVLAAQGRDLRGEPFSRRRATLVEMLGSAPPPIFVTPATEEPSIARGWLDVFDRDGIDGVVAKPLAAAYQPGKRALVKVKTEHTVDCVVAGMRIADPGDTAGSLLLGLYDDTRLRHVGVASSFTKTARVRLYAELAPLAIPLRGHPWETGFGLEASPVGRLGGSAGRWEPGMSLDWVPLRPETVYEVAFDRLDGLRFRHPARAVRPRPDRDPRSCTIDQLRAIRKARAS